MKITKELLDQYEACDAGYDLFLKKYPNGEEAIKVIEDKDITLHMLHYGAKYLPYTKEEWDKYQERCNIVNSKFVCASDNIENCRIVGSSSYVKNSESVKDSKNILNSNHIYTSEDIESCQEVFNCKNLLGVNFAINTSDSHHCNDLVDSHFINWSNHIFNSLMVDDSSFVYNSSDIRDCHFSGLLTNCSNCSCCIGLENSEYMIFNKPVSQIVYERFQEELLYYLPNENYRLFEINGKKPNPDDRYNNINLINMYANLSDDFINWIKSIKYYDAVIFSSLAPNIKI